MSDLQCFLHVCFSSCCCAKPGTWYEENESLQLRKVSKKREKILINLSGIIVNEGILYSAWSLGEGKLM